MNKILRIISLALILTCMQNAYSQVMNYNHREWDEDWAYLKFSDHFSDSSLDPENWLVQTNFGREACVFIDSPLTHSIDDPNDKLQLSMIYQPGNCYSLDSQNICPDYIGAELLSKDKFKYGIYEGRMKFATGIGTWPAFWFFGGSGADNPSFNNGYASEIDIAEYNWNHQGTAATTDHVFHWWWPFASEQMAIPEGKETNNVDWSNWHTFKMIYTPYYVKFYIDNEFSWERSKFYVNYTIPGDPGIFQKDISVEDIDNNTTFYEHQWFPKHEGHIILSQQVASVQNIVHPQTTYFDWITFKEFFLSPEINSPDVVCTSISAILDVVQEASNISWTLSPAVLFSGATNGTGTSATITAANNMRGEGKITYSFDMPSGESFDVEETFWVGKPDIFLDYGYITSGDGGGGYVCTDQTGNEIDLSYYNEVENGDCDNYEIKLTNISGSQVVDQFYTSNGIGGLDYSSLSEGFYLLSVRAHNTCGWSDWVDTEIEFTDCSAMFLMFTPNPATSETTLSIESNSGEEEFKSESYEWDIEIYDSSQILKEKKLKIKGKEFKLNTADWKEGVYYTRVKVDDKIIKGRLAVKK